MLKGAKIERKGGYMIDENEFDLFDIGKTDEEIRDFDNVPSYYELQQENQLLREENRKLKEQEEKRKQQTEKARQRRKEQSGSQDVYRYIQSMKMNGYKRKDIIGSTYITKAGKEIVIGKKQYENAMYGKVLENKGGKIE